jgi:hypothetical protein
MGITFVEDRFQSEGIVVCKSTGHVVRFCIADHETEICFKSKAFLVHSGFELRTHSADIHRGFDDLKIAITTISLRGKGMACISILGCTISDWINRL